MVEKDYSEVQIQKEDEEKVKEFHRFLNRATLSKNSLERLIRQDGSTRVKKEKELRIVLVGKVGA